MEAAGVPEQEYRDSRAGCESLGQTCVNRFTSLMKGRLKQKAYGSINSNHGPKLLTFYAAGVGFVLLYCHALFANLQLSGVVFAVQRCRYMNNLRISHDRSGCISFLREIFIKE